MKRTLTPFARTLALPLAVLACGWTTLPAAAQAPKLDIRPGLWELNNRVSSPDPQMQSAMTQMQAQLANMSPEQRQSLQQMLDRNGVQIKLGAGGALQSRMCMTPEMIARQELPIQEGNCTQNTTPLSGNRLKIAFSCTKPRTSGEGEMTMDSDTSYRARVKIRSEERGTVDMDVNGKWLGADCGSVRPTTAPKGK
jgi:hypothetical protein